MNRPKGLFFLCLHIHIGEEYMKAYQKKKEHVLQSLKVKEESGLSTYEAKQRSIAYGKNELNKKKDIPLYVQFLKQFEDPMVFILLCACIVSIFLKEIMDACIILFVLLVNATIGFLQEYKAEKAIEALKKLSAPQVHVKRDGFIQKVDASTLVVGDIVILEAGNYVPADIRLLKATSLQVEESILTGESDVVLKDADIVYPNHCDPCDQKNMVFMSTFVCKGHAVGVVCACAKESEVGKIAALLNEEKKDKTPLQKRLALLSKYLGIVTIALCVCMFIIYRLQNRAFFEILLLSISLAVAAIPEGLPAVVSIVLALGVSNMSKQKAIVKNLPSVETLGSVSVICCDKTGTLTQNKMQVQKVLDATIKAKDNDAILQCMALCNNAAQSKDTWVGEPTEIALLQYVVKKQAIETYTKTYPRIHEIAFDSKKKYMISVHAYQNEYYAFMKGALEKVLERCSYYLKDDEICLLTLKHKEKIMEEATLLANASLRILAFAKKRIPYPEHLDENANFIFVGLCGLMDPPREGVKESVETCINAGIKVVMISGDNASTASAIAQNLNIIQNKQQVLTKTQLDMLSDVQLEQKIHQYRVFARVTPKDKVRLVNAFKKCGEVVCMSGDGVNDAPALKCSDIGVAMGKNGSDVCKQSSDIILSDDNFSTIVHAIEEGRNIYLNIQKAVLYLLSCNLGEIIALFLASLCMPDVVSTLHAVQILWVNLVTDSFPALSLGVDPKDRFIMQEKPRDSKESIFGKDGLIFTILNGTLIGTLSVVAFRYGLNTSETMGQTMAFMVLSISQLLHALNLTSSKHSLLEVGVFKNRWLILTIVLSIIVQISVCHIPLFQIILKTCALSLKAWMIVFALSFVVILVNEISKWVAKEK